MDEDHLDGFDYVASLLAGQKFDLSLVLLRSGPGLFWVGFGGRGAGHACGDGLNRNSNNIGPVTRLDVGRHAHARQEKSCVGHADTDLELGGFLLGATGGGLGRTGHLGHLAIELSVLEGIDIQPRFEPRLDEHDVHFTDFNPGLHFSEVGHGHDVGTGHHTCAGDAFAQF